MPKVILKEGAKLHDLTLIRKIDDPSGKGTKLWLCECKCGSLKTYPHHNLGRSTKSCGCRKSPDLTGKRFGRLVVESDGGMDGDRRCWVCACDCGGKKTVHGTSLKRKQVQSCGCLLRATGSACKRWRGVGNISASRFLRYIHGASRRDLEFTITIDAMWNLFEKQKGKCALTGLPICFPIKKPFKKVDSTASLDRIDSAKGYVPGNVQWVHRDINMMKHAHPLDYFVYLCRLVCEHQAAMPVQEAV